jgi:colanic acid/amylovoran biosynthesis protein
LRSEETPDDDLSQLFSLVEDERPIEISSEDWSLSMAGRKSMKILVLHFYSLNNYGTAMMGLNTIYYLRELGCEFSCDFIEETDIEEVSAELNCPEISIDRVSFVGAPHWMPSPLRKVRFIKRMLMADNVRGFDAVIVLGGDDLSEYYQPSVWMEFLSMFFWSFRCPVFLLGQSIGPFSLLLNRMACRYMAPRLNIVARDKWSSDYLLSEFGLKKKVQSAADLAFLDLPRQHDPELWSGVSRRYGLHEREYITVVVSGLNQRHHYTTNSDDYVNNWLEIIKKLIEHPQLVSKKICLLAHVFGGIGDEGRLICEVMKRVDEKHRGRIVAIADRILPNRARLVLGNGFFTITGRMHAAVSSFQMGIPAISLAYSEKYYGVLGSNLGRSDLIVDCKGDEHWRNLQVARKVLERVDYLLSKRVVLREEIAAGVASQKQAIGSALQEMIEVIKKEK